MFENETNLHKLVRASRSTILSDKYKLEARDRLVSLKKNKFKPKCYADYLRKSGYSKEMIQAYIK